MKRNITFMTIDDVEHYSQEQRSGIVAAYLPHEREARAKGVPVLGSGRVFRFKHVLIRDVAYDLQPRARRRQGSSPSTG